MGGYSSDYSMEKREKARNAIVYFEALSIRQGSLTLETCFIKISETDSTQHLIKYSRVSYRIPYFARSPSHSSIRMRRLYFAIRSVREREPVLMNPALTATARSAMKVSYVSPERWEMIEIISCSFPSAIASRVSDTVPI